MKSISRSSFVVTGATGNNFYKAIFPAFVELWRDTCQGKDSGLHPESRIVLVGRQGFDAGTAEEAKHQLIWSFSRHGSPLGVRVLRDTPGLDRSMLDRLLSQVDYVLVRDTASEEQFGKVIAHVNAIEANGESRRVVWFLNQDSKLNQLNAAFIGRAKSSGKGPTDGDTLLIEKPMGDSLESCVKFKEQIDRDFAPAQQYFVDHYLGKAFTVWFKDWLGSTHAKLDNTTVDWILVLLAEKELANNRAAYYDGSGALRDMGQNHMLQLLALTCMERPTITTPGERSKFQEARAHILRNIKPLRAEDVRRAQYRGYLSEPGVPPDSDTETAFAMRLTIDLPRWDGVPMYAISGKGFPWTSKKIVVRFKPRRSYLDGMELPADIMVINWEPEPGIYWKQSGTVGEKPMTSWSKLKLREIQKQSESAYARIIRNCVRGDHFVFPTGEEILDCWRICEPALHEWNLAGANGLYHYDPGEAPREFGSLFQGLPEDMPWHHESWIGGGR